MRVLIAPDSFKDSLSALEVSDAINRGICEFFPDMDTILLPLADGGEGTLDAITTGLNGGLVSIMVSDPMFRDIKCVYGRFEHNAVIEMAKASGLELLTSSDRNPLFTSSYGTGQLIRHAVAAGCTHLTICIGGSATNDGGMGMLQALGYEFLDAVGQPVQPIGQNLRYVSSISDRNVLPSLKGAVIKVACDVSNPLLGSQGATYVFGPQKGATRVAVEDLEFGTQNFARVTEKYLGHDFGQVPGAGAAGGLGFALVAFLGATLCRGFELVSDQVALESKIRAADWVITGEGKLDATSLHGKVPQGVLSLARKHNKPTTIICGTKGDGWEHFLSLGCSQILALTDYFDREYSLRQSRYALQEICKHLDFNH